MADVSDAREVLQALHGPTDPWWRSAVIYQIYPISYQDSNGDGAGDLPGILRRLDHLAWLGVDALWLSPIYPSPMADFGYDVADYTDVDPRYGSLEDLDRLVAAAHTWSLRVLLDFVPNHTSDRHPWFVELRSSRTSPKRDWYLWADPAPGGGPPNNWRATFGGSAWTLDEGTGQYYYHAFLPEQPDLNWRNAEVRRAMADILRFWLRRGVDGFRVDVIWHLIKDLELRDNPPHPEATPETRPYRQLEPVYTTDRPEVHEVVELMRDVVDEFPDRLLIGEIYLPLERLVTYYGSRGRGVHLPFNFQLLTLAWDARAIEAAVERYELLLPAGAWPNWVLGNHDQPRVATRIGLEQARIAAMLLLTLRGTPTVYYGDEIGMANVEIPADRRLDPASREPGFGRDGQRTPMQWRPGPAAGFTTGRPWLPVSSESDRVNVETEAADPQSMLSLHRRLIELRRAEPALALGSYEPLRASGSVLAYVRRRADRCALVALNLGQTPASLALPPGTIPPTARVRLSTYLDRHEPVAGELALRSNEGVVVGAPD